MIKRRIPFRSKINFFNDPTTKALTGWLKLAAADSDDKKAINHAVLTSFQTPKFFLDRAFTDALQRKARGQNYLTWLAGNWNTVYEGRQEWRNKNVKKYVDTLLMVQQFEGSPDEVLNQILNIKGVGFKK